MQLDSTSISAPVDNPGEVARDMDMFARCAFYSFRPSIYSFFGEAESILTKMDAIPEKLADLRTFILAVESSSAAEVRLFERVDGDKWAVSSWRGAAIGDLNARMADSVMENSGVLCIGEQLKSLLTSELDLSLEGVVPAPVSARAAFGHAVRGLGTDTFIRATAAMLC